MTSAQARRNFSGELNNKQIGLPTGDPRNFKTFDEFFAAYQAQHEYEPEWTRTAKSG